jgi:hypothetical protein
MDRLLCKIVLLGLLFSSAAALANESRRQATMDQRQIRACMSRRMSADRTLPYNDAKRTCAEQLKAQNSGPVPAPVTGRIAGGGI